MAEGILMVTWVVDLALMFSEWGKPWIKRGASERSGPCGTILWLTTSPHHTSWVQSLCPADL